MGSESEDYRTRGGIDSLGCSMESMSATKLDQVSRLPNQEDFKPPKLNFRDYLLVATFSFINVVIGAAYCVLAPFFPREAELKGLSPSTTGILFAIQEVIAFILCPIYGILLPKLGFRRTLLVGSLVAAIGITSFGTLKWSPGGSTFTALCALIRSFGSVGLAALSASSYAAIPVYYPGHISKFFGFLEMSFCIGMIVGSSLGGVLYHIGGFDLPFFFCGGLMFLAFPLIFFLFPRIEKLPKSGKRAGISKILSNYRITLMMTVTLITCTVWGFNQSTLEPHVRKFANLDISKISLLFLCNGLFYGIATYGSGLLFNKFKDLTFMSLVGIILTIIAFIFVGPMWPIPMKPSLTMVIASQILYGTGAAICLVSNFTQAIREKDKSELRNDLGAGSIISSLFVSTSALGSAIGPIIGGYLVEHLNFRKSCVFIVALNVVMALVVVMSMLFHKRPDVEENQVTTKVPVQRLGSLRY